VSGSVEPLIALGLFIIAGTFLGMALELFRLANAPTSLDLRWRAGGAILEHEARVLAKLRIRRIAARLSAVMMLVAGATLASITTTIWL
jgi:hypothetical protein